MMRWMLLAALCVLAAYATAESRSLRSCRSLDVTRDHRVTSADALMVLRAAVGLDCRPTDAAVTP